MKNFKYIVFLLPIFVISCIEDDSKYGGREIDEITIEGIPPMIEVELFTNLKVNPTVTTKSGNDGNLSYVWYKYNQEQVEADTLSFEKNLDVVIVDVIPGVMTTLALKVTDTATGIFTLHRTTFTTIGHYSGGTLMLCRNGTEYDLAMLKKDGVTFYDNMFSEVNDGEKLPAQTTRLFLCDGDARNTMEFKAIIAASNDATGGYYIDPTTLIIKSTMRDKFSVPEVLPPTLDITFYSMCQDGDFLVVNEQVYKRPNINSSSDETVTTWYPATIILSEPKDYHMAPYAAQYSGSPYFGAPIFFDNLHGRMLYTSTGGVFSLIDNVSGTAFDPNDMAGIEMVMCGNNNSSPDYSWGLMKDTGTGEFVLVTYHAEEPAPWYPMKFFADSKITLSQTGFPELYGATGLIPGTKQKVDTYSPWQTTSSGESNIFFFIHENKVYAFNANNSAYSPLIDGNDENFTVTGVDCTNIPTPTESNPDASMNQLTLRIKDNNLSSKPGGIVVYRLGSVGGLTATKLYQKTGFCDEVVHSVEKKD